MPYTKVFVTVDVEMWPPHWDADSKSYSESFKRYVYGVGNPREYGLPFQLKIFSDHGIKASFFVETLFSSVLGKNALEEVVGLIGEAGQEVQLHIHPEWLGRSDDESLPGPPCVSLRELSVERQSQLLTFGLKKLEQCGARDVTAFRAGSFSASRSTLQAVKLAGLRIDASHNAAARQGPMDPAFSRMPAVYDGVVEVPLTVYRDAFFRLRGLQIGSSGLGEMIGVCNQAAEAGYDAVTVLCHSAELLNGRRSRVDSVAKRRFTGFCAFLEHNSDRLMTHGFNDVGWPTAVPTKLADELVASVGVSARRYLEQAIRKLT